MLPCMPITDRVGDSLYEPRLCNAFQICDRISYPSIVSCLGNLTILVAFIFIGPLPFIPIRPTVPMLQAVMAVFGLGIAFVMVSTYSRSQIAANRKGFVRDIETYLFISGELTECSIRVPAETSLWAFTIEEAP